MWGAAPPLGLAPFGLVVIDGTGWRRLSGSTPSWATVAALRRPSLVLAYLSVGTVHRDRPYADQVEPEWLLGPVPGRAGERYVDVRCGGWRLLLLVEVRRLIEAGFDGIYVAGLEVAHELRAGARSTMRLVSAVRDVCCEHVLVAQDGLLVADELAVDAIAHEGVFLRGGERARPSPAQERDALVAALRHFRDRGQPVFTLDFAPPGSAAAADAVRRSCAQGFRPAVTVPALDRPPHGFAPIAGDTV